MSIDIKKHFKPNEMPSIWGSPAKPNLPGTIRLLYGVGFIIVLLTASLQNNLIIAYIDYLQGDMGFTPTQGACITAAYYMGNVWTTIMLFRFRQHFGLKVFFTCIFIVLLFSEILELSFSNFVIVVFARFIGGVVGGGISVLCIFYTIQMLPTSKKYLLFPTSIGLTQIGSALSHFIVAYFSMSDYPHLMNFFEIGFCLIAFCTFLLIELPPSHVAKAFFPEDFTVILFALGTALCCLIFSVGNVVWWHYDRIAYGLCIGIASFGIFFIAEFFKKRPFIHLNFLLNIQLLEISLAAAFVRMCLAEQSTGATGLFRDVLNFSDYQLMGYYGILTLGALSGGLSCLYIYNYERSHGMVLFAAALIPLGSFLSMNLSIDMLPSNIYLGQFLIAFASVFFIGPLLANGIILGVARGTNYVITFAVIFTFSQGVFGLLGSAIIEYFIKSQSIQNAQDLINNNITNPHFDAHSYDIIMQHAGILAYEDLFFAIGAIGSVIFVILLMRYIYLKLTTNSLRRELDILKTRSIKNNAKTAKILESLQATHSIPQHRGKI